MKVTKMMTGEDGITRWDIGDAHYTGFEGIAWKVMNGDIWISTSPNEGFIHKPKLGNNLHFN